LSELAGIFLNAMLPIFLIAGAGYLVGKWLKIDPRSVSQMVFYLFSPCLVFTLLTENQLTSNDIFRMIGFAALIAIITGALALFVGRVFKLERSIVVVILLTTIFSNVGNYGLPLNLFAFGEQALAHATLYFVTNLILLNTLGVVIASMGNTSFKESLIRLVKFPSSYALVAAILFSQLHWQLPEPLVRTVNLLGDATIPSMLVVLGLQFQTASWRGNILALSFSNIIRLLVSPALAFGLCILFGLKGVARQAGILESAMPSAVLASILATEFNVQPALVTTVVFISTVLSPLTLIPLVAYLR
jgi:predicted permease